MANFVITTQKPNSSELNASRPKTAGKGMEDAFNSLMSNKEVNPSRPVGQQDGNSGRRENQNHQRHEAQQHERQVKKTRDQAHMTQQARLYNGQIMRQPLPHTTPQHLSMVPEALIQRRSDGGQSGQQEQREQQQHQPQSQTVEEVALDSPSSAPSDIFDAAFDEDTQVTAVADEQEIGSIFDDIELNDDFDAVEPARLDDETSVYDMIASQSGDAGQDNRRDQSRSLNFTVPGEASDQTNQTDQASGAPVHSAEEAQLLAAALDKTSGHYPEGSVGRALQEGKINQEALHKLFEHWKQQRSNQKNQQTPNHRLPHYHGHMMPRAHNHALLIPELNLKQQGVHSESGDDSSERASARELPESVAAIYEYIRERVVESIWVAQSPHALAEGVVVNLQGDKIGGSRFMVRKIQDRIEVTFYIKDEEFYSLAQGFQTTLAEAIQKKCGASSVNIGYHRIGASDHATDAADQALPAPPDSVEEDDDLWA